MNPIIIIGAGLAGWSIAREFRRLDTTTPVMMITADSGDFYAKPSLSNAFAQKRTPEQLVTTPAAKMAQTLGVTLLAHTPVQFIDVAARTVTSSAGIHAWGRLVLATGAQPIRVPVAGNAAALIKSVNSLDDFRALHGSLQPGHHVLIMGAGLIGCEFANDLAIGGYRVSVVDPSSRPLAALLPEPAGVQLQTALSDLGVNWHFGTTVQSVELAPPAGSVPDGAPGLHITLSNGTLAQAAIVLSAIGLRANLALAQSAGLHCERGILVDTHLQTSAPNIFALGDGAQYASAPGQTAADGSRRGATLPFVMPIMNAARALAATLAGQPAELVFPLMPVAIKTPALPITVSPPPTGTAGQWESSETGVWQYLDADQLQHGFALTGAHTAKRADQVKRTQLPTREPVIA
jgi:rubredoxin-NAD+ reductase